MGELDRFVNDCNSFLIQQTGNETADEKSIAENYLLKHRGFSNQSLLTHKIGYCHSSYSLPLGISDPKGEGYNHSSSILGRIIIPIMDEFDNVVAFGTRNPTLDSGESWWNFIFDKSSHLFLLNLSRRNIFKNNKIYLVEGYADAITLFQHGLTSVCGIMGTALSLRHIGLITRYCNNVCLCMDVDENESGQKAKENSIYRLVEFGTTDEITVIDDLPVGSDPDSFVKQKGIDEFLSFERFINRRETDLICSRVKARMSR